MKGLSVILVTLMQISIVSGQNDYFTRLQPAIYKVDSLIENDSREFFKNVESVIIYERDGIKFEKYYNGFKKDSLHQIQSQTKSILSLLAGIAIDQGFIKDENEPVRLFFPEYFDSEDNLKFTLTIRDLLTMSAGFRWEELIPFEDPGNDNRKMFQSMKWFEYALSRPMAEKPFTSFKYNSGCPIIVGAIIEKTSGMNLNEFADKYLFGPLEITRFGWMKDSTGLCHGGGGLFLSPSDMMKIGVLVLNKGVWNHRRIVSEDWIRKSTTSYLTTNIDNSSYGYFWWIRQMKINEDRTTKVISAEGAGGQKINILPEYGLIIAFTERNYSSPQVGPMFLSQGLIPVISQLTPVKHRIDDIENVMTDLTGKSPSAVTLTAELKKYNVPGLGFVVIDSNKISIEKYYGVVKINTDKEVTNRTLFEAASVTKMLTAIMVLHLADEGRIKLDEDINKYLVKWKVPGTSLTDGSPVTIGMILTHTAGFNRPDGGFSMVPGTGGKLTDILNGSYPARNKPLIIEQKPGSWNYSNFGYIVLQLLLEEITGKSFQALAKEIIFDPLGMTDSSVGLPLTREQLTEKAYSHSISGTQAQHGLQEQASAHAGLVITPRDMAKLMIEIMQSYKGESNRILSEEYTRKLFQNRISPDPAAIGGIEAGQGYGVMVRGKPGNICFFMAGQNLPGATCIIAGFPDTGQGAVIMTNSENGELIQLELLESIGKVYAWPSSKVL
ncbi:MAG TPA: serine hydrolase [Bacteroidales bacterium]|jgi:CubicO group peptidase (beta-lactamase class C family)|nr:serine hydrolase [Bacteroidales bacterium]